MGKSAIPLYSELVAKMPDVATYHYRFAMTLWQTGDTAGGIHEFQTALKLNPSDQEKVRIQQMLATGGVRK